MQRECSCTLQPRRGSKRMSTISISSQRRRGSVLSTHSRDGGPKVREHRTADHHNPHGLDMTPLCDTQEALTLMCRHLAAGGEQHTMSLTSMGDKLHARSAMSLWRGLPQTRPSFSQTSVSEHATRFATPSCPTRGIQASPLHSPGLRGTRHYEAPAMSATIWRASSAGR
jgi:hypothetical protein